MSVLIIVEHDNQKMSPVTRNIVRASMELDKNPTLLVAGYNCASVVKEAASIQNVQSVWHADNECYKNFLAEPLSKLIVNVAESFSHILVSSTTFGKNVLPRVAALLDVTQVTDVVKIVDESTFIHPIYAGNALEKVKVFDNKKVLTIRTTAFDPVNENQDPCCIETINYVDLNNKSEFISQKIEKSNRPDLNAAERIVSGGRGLQSAEQFKLVDDLASVLGAAVGASRAAVDAGFVPNDYQVGQTGKIVAPNLYIALGISGAVQHLAGMKDSKVIVAINIDEDAPIFQIATYGLVGDVFDLVPKLIDEINNRGIAKC